MLQLLGEKDLVIEVDSCKARLIWIRDVVEGIYEVSVQFVGGGRDGGYSLWYVNLSPEGECNFIACSMYKDAVTDAIKEAEAKAKPHKDLLAKLNVRI